MIGYRAIIFEVREKRAIKLRSSPRPGVVSKGTASHLIKTAPSVVFFFFCARSRRLSSYHNLNFLPRAAGNATLLLSAVLLELNFAD